MSVKNETFIPEPQATRPLRDLLTYALCLIVLTLAAGLMLDQAGIVAMVCPAGPNGLRDGDVEALLSAIHSGDVPAVRRLLRKRGANVNGADNAGGTPISCALRVRGANATLLLDLLIEAGADVNARSGGGAVPVLVQAAILRRPDLVERLLRGGAEPNRSGRDGWTPLHFAAMCDDADTAAVLLAAAADPAAMNDEGQTPLDVALANQSLETARRLTRAARRGSTSPPPLHGAKRLLE